MAPESVPRYQPPHKRAVTAATQRQHSLHLPQTELDRTTVASRPRCRLSNGSQNFLQSSEARAVSNAAANSTGSKAVPASGAVASSKFAAVQSNGRSTQAKSNALHSHSSSAMGELDFVADVQLTAPSLVELLTSADTAVRLDTASEVAKNLLTVNSFVNEQLKANQLASGQQKADTNGQQKENANGPQEAGPMLKGQPKAKVDAVPEGQLEVGESLAQRSKANPGSHAKSHGHAEFGSRATVRMVFKAEKGPSTTAIHCTGTLVSTHKHSCLM